MKQNKYWLPKPGKTDVQCEKCKNSHRLDLYEGALLPWWGTDPEDVWFNLHSFFNIYSTWLVPKTDDDGIKESARSFHAKLGTRAIKGTPLMVQITGPWECLGNKYIVHPMPNIGERVKSSLLAVEIGWNFVDLLSKLDRAKAKVTEIEDAIKATNAANMSWNAKRTIETQLNASLSLAKRDQDRIETELAQLANPQPQNKTRVPEPPPEQAPEESCGQTHPQQTPEESKGEDISR